MPEKTPEKNRMSQIARLALAFVCLLALGFGGLGVAQAAETLQRVEAKKDAAARTGVDPVTGKPVDKATAIIAALEDGSVLYFESEKTFEQYSKGDKGEKK